MSDRPTPSGQLRRATTDDREARFGSPLLLRLHGVLRGLRLYDSTNQALRDQLDELMNLVSSVMEDEVTLLGLGDHFYLNGVRLKADAAHINLHRALMAELEARGLGGLRFASGVTAEELEKFLRLFLAARDAEQGEQLPDRALTAGILHVLPILTKDMGVQSAGVEGAEGGGGEGERQRARQVFWRALHGTQTLVTRTAQTGRPALHMARRLVQPIVDSILKDECSIIGLTAMKDHDEYTYAHCVNVSVLSISMGQVVGFPRQVLANLGVAGLLHDIGKLMVPVEVLQKPGQLTPEEWASVHHHPLSGVRIISRLPSFSALTLDAMRTAFQHHMNLDQSGYPDVPTGSRLAAFPRIVAVADFFDAVTSHRAYRRRAFTGFEALHTVMGPQRKNFDPGAVWALVRTVGLYPAGSVLLTASGHVVLSLSPNRADLRRPHSRVLLRPDSSMPDPEAPEIWDPMPVGEHVVRVLDPDEVPVDTTGLLAA
jgi:HD-GYP domain-containing protein (c-di-GMP phosphodiesterase class II)